MKVTLHQILIYVSDVFIIIIVSISKIDFLNDEYVRK